MATGRNQLLNDPEEATRVALDGRQSNTWTAMPGIVVSVNLAKMTCEVQLAIQGEIEDEDGNVQYVALPVLPDVPIHFPSAGGFAMTFPLKANDEVLVVFASRCIDSWWQQGGFNNKAMEDRMHDLSDGFAIPGIFSQPNVYPSVSATTVQIRNKAGTSYIEIDATGAINVVSPVGINLIGPVNVAGALGVAASGGGPTTATIKADIALTGGITQTGNNNLTGTQTITGNTNQTGNIVATLVTASGIGLSTHKHIGVTVGSGTSGIPTP